MATLLFVIFWVALGLVILWIALRGGVRGARQSLYGERRGTARVATGFFVLFYVALGVAIPLLIITGDRGSSAVAGTGVKLTKQQETGRDTFGRRCGQCHTLAASKTVGQVGPSLDALIGGIKEEKARAGLVLSAVNQGRQRGNGTMPAGLVQGQQAQDVASYVAAVAGK